MFRNDRRVRAFAGDVANLERRMRGLERQLERVGSSAGKATRNFSSGVSQGVSQATDRVGDALTSTWDDLAERYRALRDSSFGDDAVRFGNQAARVGQDAMQRLSREVEHRPLVLLGIAAGVGLLIGMAGRRR
jgi:ElaB/YqjD/DUF883 family membrane-anchored ribosome-binding protein